MFTVFGPMESQDRSLGSLGFGMKPYLEEEYLKPEAETK